MSTPPRVLCVIGTSGRQSATHTVLVEIARQLRLAGWECDIFDPATEPLPLFNPESSHAAAGFRALKERVDRADVLVLGTPDYHGSISSTLKNFLDHFWQEFCGRLFVPVVVSHEKGLTVIDQLRTVARQCYAWTIPYGISIAAQADVKDGVIISEPLKARLEMLVGDIKTYGVVLSRQRQADLAGSTPGFLARLRKP